ncbi:MAG: chorismate mutase [Candidatus Zixiibacteriota bacterium]
MNKVRGIRGAIQIPSNTSEEIFGATKELLTQMIEANDIDYEDIASIFFTATDDINADFPAYAARDMGLGQVPLLCAREINVPNGMKSLVRILIHFNTEKEQFEIKHQYLGATAKLRPDLN